MGLALGGAHPATLVALAPVCFLGVALVLRCESRTVRLPAPTIFALALAGYTLLQALPLPLSILRLLSPAAADTWARSLYPFAEDVTWGSISHDPGASLRESLKWSLYGALFLAATTIARRYGRHACALVVFVSALAVALTTVIHGLANAQRVFGIYDPTFEVARWRVGPLLNPNNLSGYLNLGGFSGLGLVLSRRWAAHRWLFAIGVATLFGVSVLSGSRGGVWLLPVGIVTFGILVFISVFVRGRSVGGLRRSGVPILLCLGCSAAFAVLGATRITWAELLSTNFEKLRILKLVIPALRDYWLVGVGRGAFEGVFPAYAPPLANAVYSHPENLVAQWLLEWGVPVGGAAIAALVWAFRSGRSDILGSGVGIGAFVGLTTLLVQNFVDLGLELPSVAMLATWSLAVVRTPAAKAEEFVLPQWYVPYLAATVMAVWVCALALGLPDAASRRQALHRQFLGTGRASEEGTHNLRVSLRDAMRAHPADPYFPRLGGMLAMVAGDSDPMPWVQRALERGINEARTHLLAANILARRGARAQALFELRRASELDPNLSEEVGALAAVWARNIDELQRAAPQGDAGARVLVAAAWKVSDHGLRQQALRTAFARDPKSVDALRGLARELVRTIESGSCGREYACAEEGVRMAEMLHRADPKRADPVELRAKALRLLGRWEEAEQVLDTGCRRLSGREQVRCLLSHLAHARLKPEPSPGEISRIATMAADQACVHLRECENVLVSIADALREAGNMPAALATYEQAVAQVPRIPTLIRVADAATSLGRYSLADAALARAAAMADDEAKHKYRIDERKDALRRAMLIHGDHAR